MKKAIHDISTGKVVVVDCADSEITYDSPTPAPAPTKEQLLAELQALTAKIQALE
jgi:hypothetical protein